MKKNPFRSIPNILAIASGFLAVGMVFACITTAFAYNGPSQNPPNGSGAIGSDSSNNVSVGTSTTVSGTKLLVVGAGSGDAGTYALQVLQNNKTPIFILRDDGSVSIETSTISAGNTVIGGNLTIGGTFTASSLGASTISAGNVSAGQFGLNTGDSGNYFFMNGNVGIGTTSPGSLLDVNGWTRIENGSPLQIYTSGGGGSGRIFGYAPWNGAGGLTFDEGGAWGGGYTFMQDPGGVSSVGIDLALPDQATGDNMIQMYNLSQAETVRLRTAGNSFFNGGNVGIGTTNPTTALTVVGNVSSTGVCLSGVCNTTWPNNSQWTATGTAIYYNGGNVGIGTANPGVPLDVNGSMRVFPSSNAGIIGWDGTGGGSHTLFALTRQSNNLAIQSFDGIGFAPGQAVTTVGTTAYTMYLQTGGNVGIGTTAPGYTLDVNGSGNFTGAVNVGTAVTGTQAVNVNYLTTALASAVSGGISGTTGYDAKFTGTNTVGNGNIFESGSNVGIGTTAPGDKLDVNGRIGAQGEYITNNALGQYALSALSIGYDTSAQQAWLQAANSSNVGTLLLNANGGNVGIGTTAPAAKLDVNGAASFENNVIHNVATPVATSDVATKSYVDSAFSLAGGISGSGGANYVPLFTGTNTLGNSAIYQSSGNVGIGTTAPSQMLSVGSGSPFTVTSAGAVTAATFSGAGTGLTGTAASLTSGALQYLGAQTQNTSGSLTSGLTVGGVYSNGYPTTFGNVLNIGGGGYGQILIGWSGTTGGTADNYIRSLRDSAVGTNNWSAWAKILTDQNYSSYALPLSGGTVTGATTFTQPVYVGTAVAGGQAVNVNYLTAALASTTNTSISGTTGYDAKFTGTNTVGNGNIFESGSNVGIGTTAPGDKLDVNGRIGAQGEYITNNALGQYALSALSIGYDTSAQQAWLQAANSSNVGTLLLNANGGNVGIGTTAPAAKLDVNGAASFENNVIHNVATPVATSDVATKSYVDSAFAGGSTNGNFATLTVTGNWNISGAAQGGLNMNGYNITGVNILGVTTIDPLYQIGGTDYETFAPSTVGVEEQASGEGTLAKSGSDYEYAINFPKLAHGSDLWVWYQAVDFSKDTVQAIATPYGQFAGIYYTISSSTLTFHGNAPAQFSFQLTGKRFDWQKWPTKAADQTRTPGFVLPVKD